MRGARGSVGRGLVELRAPRVRWERAQPVEIGRASDHFVEITQGVKVGEGLGSEG